MFSPLPLADVAIRVLMVVCGIGAVVALAWVVAALMDER